MNKNSLLFTITLFFILLIVLAHLIVYTGYNITKQQQIDLLVAKYMKTIHQVEKEIFGEKRPPMPILMEEEIMHKRPMLPPDFPKFDEEKFRVSLEKYDMNISEIKYEELKKDGKILAKDMDWELYEFDGFNYFYKWNPFNPLLIKDNLKITKKTQHIILLTILFNILFIGFYVFLIKKLKPLHTLKENIKKFSKGDLEIDTSCNGKDEISEVSNEFNNAKNQIKTLRESRNLFLRNIMHELKTPITKGLLISNMMSDGKQKESLKKLFYRLEYLLEEFAKIEKFSSKNNIPLNIQEYRVIDILDEALDLLFLDKNTIDLEIKDNAKIKVDFEMFSLVLKNLIDNADKYGKIHPKIVVEKNYISISNEGEKLPFALETFDKPFNRKYESAKKGLGLGLYIVNSILQSHNIKLDYIYEEGLNTFVINY